MSRSLSAPLGLVCRRGAASAYYVLRVWTGCFPLFTFRFLFELYLQQVPRHLQAEDEAHQRVAGAHLACRTVAKEGVAKSIVESSDKNVQASCLRGIFCAPLSMNGLEKIQQIRARNSVRGACCSEPWPARDVKNIYLKNSCVSTYEIPLFDKYDRRSARAKAVSKRPRANVHPNNPPFLVSNGSKNE